MSKLTDLQWVAGIIDAEGSMELLYLKKKIKGQKVKSRCAMIKIATCDNIIIPQISQIINKRYNINKIKRKNRAIYSIRLTGNQVRTFLPKIIKYLYIKQPQAELCLKALNIKNGKNEFYTKDEANLWESYRIEMKRLNERGKNAAIDDKERMHKFSWPWLAGLIDGDGSITLSQFGPRKRPAIKPVIKITLAHLLTISYLCKKFNRTELKGGKIRGNRRLTKTIRFMSTDIYNIVPKIMPYLKLRKRLAELSYRIVCLRRTTTHKINPMVVELLDKFKQAKINLDYNPSEDHFVTPE